MRAKRAYTHNGVKCCIRSYILCQTAYNALPFHCSKNHHFLDSPKFLYTKDIFGNRRQKRGVCQKKGSENCLLTATLVFGDACFFVIIVSRLKIFLFAKLDPTIKMRPTKTILLHKCVSFVTLTAIDKGAQTLRKILRRITMCMR